MQVTIIENVLKLNDEVAQLNRAQLKEAGVFCINIIGSPGSGKTALLEATLQRLNRKYRVAVAVGDLATDRDGQRLGKHCGRVVQINTGKGCHLDANQVRQALPHLGIHDLDLLVIENVGNLICPVGFDLGQDVKIGLFSVSEGDDKPAKHPYLVKEASLLLLNKTDLLPYVPFDLPRFRGDVKALNPDVPLLEISVKNGDLGGWINYLEHGIAAAKKILEPQLHNDAHG